MYVMGLGSYWLIAEGLWFQMTSYEMNVVMYASELWNYPTRH